MTLKTPHDYVAKLRKNPKFYSEMAEKEGRYWSGVQTDVERPERLREVQEAGQELRINRDAISITSFVRKHGLHFKRGLSLGCGEGRAEMAWYKQGWCDSFHGIDVAELSVEKARENARDLPFTYEVSDLNTLKLDENAYDFVGAQTILHHCLELEHICREVSKALTPDGIFYVIDFVGDTQMQWLPIRKKITSAILDALPEKLRWDSVNNRLHPGLVDRPIPNANSPFESIRSGDIPGVLREHFEIVESVETDSILYGVTARNTLRGWTENEDTKAAFEMLLALDKVLIETGILPPMNGIYFCRKKR